MDHKMDRLLKINIKLKTKVYEYPIKIKSKRKSWMTKSFINEKHRIINMYNKTYESTKQNTKKIKYNKSKTRKYK